MKGKAMHQTRNKILIVDDDEKILFAFQEVFKKEGYKSIIARNGDEALRKIAAERPHAVFMDIAMPRMNGLEVLQHMKLRSHDLPVVLVTGYGTMQTAIKAMQLGAFEYLTKPLDVEKVRDVAKRALRSQQTKHPGGRASDALRAEFVDRYEIVGNSAQMHDVYKLIGSVSTTPNHTSVLILGESGTGKELVARAIHSYSSKSTEPFVAINCTVLPEALLESELFGHEKGAFTGAVVQKIGKFEMAGTGTIFLDEIGNLSPTLQQKLLRVLQEREVERLGGNDLIRVDARFIAATNRDLAAEVAKGTFREDLLYRLNVVSIHLPPLRERGDDVTLLANYFLAKYNEQLKKFIQGFSDEAMGLLQAYSFPGNVRELENLIERAVMVSNGRVILPYAFGELALSQASNSRTSSQASLTFADAREAALRTFERDFVVRQLRRHNGNVTEAARSSKMTRQNFQRLMKKFGVRSGQFRS